MTEMTPLKQIARIIRSKNAGPFEVTFDIIFGSREDYETVKRSGVITPALIAELYHVAPERILTFVYFDIANAIKITLPRPRPQGSIGETDMHCAQQHVPLTTILIPWPPAD